jgi:ATP-dependent Clp protease protease subunit
LNSILKDLTRQPLEKIEADTDRDFYMTSEQAREYGIVDEVMVTRPSKQKDKGASS